MGSAKSSETVLRTAPEGRTRSPLSLYSQIVEKITGNCLQAASSRAESIVGTQGVAICHHQSCPQITVAPPSLVPHTPGSSPGHFWLVSILCPVKILAVFPGFFSSSPGQPGVSPSWLLGSLSGLHWHSDQFHTITQVSGGIKTRVVRLTFPVHLLTLPIL